MIVPSYRNPSLNWAFDVLAVIETLTKAVTNDLFTRYFAPSLGPNVSCLQYLGKVL